MMKIPIDSAYAETVYAGVLGKIIGVYAGRPFEGWTHEQIVERLGEIDRYVANELGVPLVVTDDDISGTFTFLRAIADCGDDPSVTAEQIGECWLNYIVENKAILWWGGIGMSTEHTAFLRLQSGIPAPRSGSIALNGRTVAEQIGAQIFIDGWGLICPGAPEQASSYAERAASVSHDGEAIYAAQVVASLVAGAFVEKDLDRLLDAAVALIPTECEIAKVIADIRSWHRNGLDWREAFQELKSNHGYAKYPSNCHVIPNHGVVILALLYGEGHFTRSLMIANTCGWDTDCNSGNVGCIVGVLGGLAGIDADYDWRGPVRDEIYLPTADGGRCVTDAVQEAREIVRIARALNKEPIGDIGASKRFDFCFPGSIQGFRSIGGSLSNTAGSLRILLNEPTVSAMTATIPPQDLRQSKFYRSLFSPTLYPGQTVRAKIFSPDALTVQIQADMSIDDVEEASLFSDAFALVPGVGQELSFRIPASGGTCVSRIGIRVQGEPGQTIQLEWLTWDGAPQLLLSPGKGDLWRQCWVNGISEFSSYRNAFDLIQNRGTGLAIYGCREWADVELEADMTVYLAKAAGLGLRVQGMRRFYALMITHDHKLQLLRGGFPDRILNECPFSYSPDDVVHLKFSIKGNRLTGTSNGNIVIEAVDDNNPLLSGAVGVVLDEGRCGLHTLRIGTSK